MRNHHVVVAATVAVFGLTFAVDAPAGTVCDVDPCVKPPGTPVNPPTNDAPRAVRTIARATGTGSYANADASGTAYEPTRLWVRVKTSPRQRASVQWTVDCTSGSDGRLISGSFETRGSKKRLRIPVTSADECSFGALASLSGRGRVTVTLTARSVKAR